MKTHDIDEVLSTLPADDDRDYKRAMMDEPTLPTRKRKQKQVADPYKHRHRGQPSGSLSHLGEKDIVHIVVYIRLNDHYGINCLPFIEQENETFISPTKDILNLSIPCSA